MVRDDIGQGLLLALLPVLIDHLDRYLARRQTLRSETMRTFGALWIAMQSQLSDAYPGLLAGTLVALAGLSVAPTQIPKLEGAPRAVFVAVVVGLMAALLAWG